ncbi:MAG: hypothetical protein LQ348_005213 [Seirophora lacunosa]|nr:MAG: hypothetical protein LQ348_005213 [Seirophora lacunosa]
MAKREITPPPLQGPTAKEKKYDRQLRLWAASGQEALENAHVLLLNSGPGVVGVEILKNLILPGVGSFTIVDEADVAEEDLGINFFLTDDSLGRSRAGETCKYLMELNPDVKGHPLQHSIQQFLLNPKVLEKYSLILFIAPSDHCPNKINTVSNYCAERGIPLFYIHSLGLYSHFSVQLPDSFPIIDTHPDPASTQDLRLLQPWPELKDFMQSKTQNLDSLSDHEHGHVPYLLLLLRFLEDWKQSHNGDPPANYKDKKEFKSFIASRARTNNPEGGEENFDEAAAAVLKSLNKPSLPSGLREIFNDASSNLLANGKVSNSLPRILSKLRNTDLNARNQQTPNFWLITQAIKEFHTKHDALPLPGALPDMKAQSKDYIQLQNIYKAKARQDIDEVTAAVRRLEKETPTPPPNPIDRKEIEAFCKGAAFVKLIRGNPLLTSNRNHNSAPRLASLDQGLKDEDSLLPIYIAFLAHDAMLQDDTVPDAEQDNDDEITLRSLQEHTRSIISNLAAAIRKDEDADADARLHADMASRVDPVLEEFVRAAGAELHNISALTGGMVAQEVIKVVTKQYVPVDNTCVFDGIASKSACFLV